MKDSWDLVAKSGDEVPLYFYSHLFLSHPGLRQMFPISMSAQRDKLVDALGRVVTNVDQLEVVTPFVRQLGQDHRRFSVVAEHYNAVGASLLATLQHFLRGSWTEQLAADWATAYGVVAKVMVEGAEAAAESQPAYWEAEVVSVERRTMDVTVLQLRPTLPYPFSPGQSFAMEIPQRPRLWRYYSPANAPREDGSVELHVQLVDGGQVSGVLVRSMKVGDTVRLGAPVGDRLTWRGEEAPDLLMVAGGTGLAPLRAVLEQVDARWEANGSGPRVHLFHGVRVPWNLYDRDGLTALAADRSWLDYTEVVSDDPSFPGARGVVGSVAAESMDWHGWTPLVCGGPSMVAHTVEALLRSGLPHEQIRYEQFHHVGRGEADDDAPSKPGEDQ